MQIVIDIDDNLYTRLFDNGVDNYDDAVDMAKAIRKGTVLPKGHGDLKDYDAIKSEYFRKMSVTMSTEFRMKLLCGIVDEAEAVIKADKEVDK